jgi:hypothetical protein
MKPFRNSSLERKLAAVILATSCLALALACAGFALYRRASVRASMICELSALAETFAKSAKVGLPPRRGCLTRPAERSYAAFAVKS